MSSSNSERGDNIRASKSSRSNSYRDRRRPSVSRKRSSRMYDKPRSPEIGDKTQMCRNVIKFGYCSSRKCRYAHSERQLIRQECAFGDICRLKDDKTNPCKFAHTKSLDMIPGNSPNPPKENGRDKHDIKYPVDIGVPVISTEAWKESFLRPLNTETFDDYLHRIEHHEMMKRYERNQSINEDIKEAPAIANEYYTPSIPVLLSPYQYALLFGKK